MFTIDTAAQEISLKLKAAYIQAYVSTLGGAERATLMLTVSKDPRSQWAYGILQNSAYANLSIERDGTIENFSGNLQPRMRKCKAKDLNDAIARINRWLEKAK